LIKKAAPTRRPDPISTTTRIEIQNDIPNYDELAKAIVKSKKPISAVGRILSFSSAGALSKKIEKG